MAKKQIRVERIRQAALGRRSSLYLWMLENHDTFAATVAEAVRPDWTALAEAFGAEGLTDSDNKPPSPEGTRQTWWKVRKAVKARRDKQPSKPEPTRLAQEQDSKPSQPSGQQAPSPVRTVQPDDDPSKPKFRYATRKQQKE